MGIIAEIKTADGKLEIDSKRYQAQIQLVEIGSKLAKSDAA